MGHKNADLDSVGAAAGMVCICRKLGKRVRIVLDLQENAAGALIAQLQQQPEYEGVFVSGQEALLMADSKSCLLYTSIGNPQGAIGILTITPHEAAIIGADVATKAASVDIIFVDRFNGSLVINGTVADVEAAMKDVLNVLENLLHFAPAVITKT